MRVDLDAFWQGHARQAPVAGDSEDGTAETMDSSQVGALDASSVPAGRPRIDSGASGASVTDQENSENPPAALLGRAAHDLSS